MHKESGQDHRPDPARMTGREAKFDEVIPWTEDDILRLHGLLLEKSLHDLFDLRVSARTRADILDWMRAPRSGSGAFTYRACCRLFGLDDEEIRDRVLERYRRRHTRMTIHFTLAGQLHSVRGCGCPPFSMRHHATASINQGREHLPGRNPEATSIPPEMTALEDSVKSKGRAAGDPRSSPRCGRYEIVAGERRWRAAKKVFGDEYEIPALVRDLDDGEADEAALIENIQRADMSPTEEAGSGSRDSRPLSGDRDEASRRLGWSRPRLTSAWH